MDREKTIELVKNGKKILLFEKEYFRKEGLIWGRTTHVHLPFEVINAEMLEEIFNELDMVYLIFDKEYYFSKEGYELLVAFKEDEEEMKATMKYFKHVQSLKETEEEDTLIEIH